MKNTKKNALIKALRNELRKLIEGEINVASLAQITNIAGQAQNLLMAIASPDASSARRRVRKNGFSNFGVPTLGAISISDGYDGENDVLAQSSAAETFGARGMREIMETVGTYLRSQNETPEKLVAALVAANTAGMFDVADKLKEKLIGKIAQIPTPTKTNEKVKEQS